MTMAQSWSMAPNSVPKLQEEQQRWLPPGFRIRPPNMKDKIKQTILDILSEKRRNGDVLPFATSIEVAHLLHMNALEVEDIAKDIEGIVKGKTLNHAYYYE